MVIIIMTMSIFIIIRLIIVIVFSVFPLHGEHHFLRSSSKTIFCIFFVTVHMWDWETSLIASLLRIGENIWKQDIKILSHVLVWLIFLRSPKLANFGEIKLEQMPRQTNSICLVGKEFEMF